MQEVASYMWLRVLPQGLCLTSSECLCVCVQAWLKVCEKALAHGFCLPWTSSVRYVIVAVETFHLRRLETVPRAQMDLKSWGLQKWFLKAHSPFISGISKRKNGWTLVLCQSSYICVSIHKDVGGLNVHCVKCKSILHPWLMLKGSLGKRLKSR